MRLPEEDYNERQEPVLGNPTDGYESPIINTTSSVRNERNGGIYVAIIAIVIAVFLLVAYLT